MRKLGLAVMLSMVLAPPALAQHGPHQHGVASLKLAIEGEQLLIEFESPLDNLSGFEHAPQTAAQREALERAEAQLMDGESLFEISPVARCVLEEVQVESPFEDEHDHHGHDHSGHDHGHDVHAEGEADDGHADMYAVWQFRCADISQITAIDVRLFERFARLSSVRAEIASPAGQTAVRLDKAKIRIVP